MGYAHFFDGIYLFKLIMQNRGQPGKEDKILGPSLIMENSFAK